MSAQEKKAVLFDLVERTTTSPLTDAERAYILREFGGDRTASYKFTDKEKEAILKALNAK